MTAVGTTPGAQQAAADLAAATVVLECRFFAPGFRRKLRSADVISDQDMVDRAAIHVRKDLIDPKALAEIGKARSRFRRWLANRTIGCAMLRGGTALVPLALVEEVVTGIDAYKLEDAALVEKLIGRYEALMADAKARLLSHYSDADYQTAEQVRAAYGITYRFISFNVPAALEQQHKEIYEREMARVQAECVEAGAEIRQALREAAAGMFEHMADRMGTDPATGKPKIFRDSIVTQMQDFLTTFAARDLTGDTALADLMAKAKALLAGVTPENLRKQETTRERVLVGAASILAQMDAAGMTTKSREFATGEEV